MAIQSIPGTFRSAVIDLQGVSSRGQMGSFRQEVSQSIKTENTLLKELAELVEKLHEIIDDHETRITALEP